MPVSPTGRGLLTRLLSLVVDFWLSGMGEKTSRKVLLDEASADIARAAEMSSESSSERSGRMLSARAEALVREIDGFFERVLLARLRRADEEEADAYGWDAVGHMRTCSR